MDKTIAFIVLGLLGFVFLTRSHTKENFVGGLPNFTTKVINSGYTLPSKVAPRFSTFDGNAQLRMSGNGGMLYNKGKVSSMPSGSNPMDDRTLDIGPLAQGYKEGFNGDIMNTSFNNGEVADMMPVGGGANKLTNPQGAPIIYDRLIFANQKSRLAAQGDPIRGDLPIVPLPADWMRPSVSPNIDLRDGALAVMGGWDNATSRKMLQLRLDSSLGTDKMGAGIDVSVAKRQALMVGQQDLIM